MENTRKLEKINEVKRKFLKIINKIDKPLAQYIKIKKGGVFRKAQLTTGSSRSYITNGVPLAIILSVKCKGARFWVCILLLTGP